jgi:hypothetical protein
LAFSILLLIFQPPPPDHAIHLGEVAQRGGGTARLRVAVLDAGHRQQLLGDAGRHDAGPTRRGDQTHHGAAAFAWTEKRINLYMGVGIGVAVDSPKLHLGLPCPTLLGPAGRPPLKQAYSCFKGGPPAGWAACDHLLPFWTPHAVHLWIQSLQKANMLKSQSICNRIPRV